MDVLQMIQDLLDERNRIDATIAKLEALQSRGKPVAGRRGRKAMSLSEREEVSRRMRNYWDRRRRDGTEPAETPELAETPEPAEADAPGAPLQALPPEPRTAAAKAAKAAKAGIGR